MNAALALLERPYWITRCLDGCRARIPVLRFRVQTQDLSKRLATGWASVAAFIKHCAKAREKLSWRFENLDRH
jgi:hypothetical protein